MNNGTTFENIFGTYGHNIADLALAPSDPNVLYVATGEANNRQTTSYGDGLYKSTDAGATFTNIGFKDSQTLGRVVVHPKDPNTVWIAVGGHLCGTNPGERGVYMTTDGGKTWNKTLYVDDKTSATEIIIDPANPLNLWAAMYQRERTAWGFNGGGPGSGIYSSIDGGKTWKKVRRATGCRTGRWAASRSTSARRIRTCSTQQIEVAMDKEIAGGSPALVANAPANAGRRRSWRGRADGSGAGGGTRRARRCGSGRRGRGDCGNAPVAGAPPAAGARALAVAADAEGRRAQSAIQRHLEVDRSRQDVDVPGPDEQRESAPDVNSARSAWTRTTPTRSTSAA